MASLNKVFIVGNLTRAPELRYIPAGSAVCDLGVAVNRRYSTANGEDREETCFVDVVVWGKQAENCNRYLTKGAPCLVEGRLKLEQWQDRETGKNRSKLQVVAERVQFLGSSTQGAQGGGGAQDSYSQSNAYSSQPTAPAYQAPPQPAAPQAPPQFPSAPSIPAQAPTTTPSPSPGQQNANFAPPPAFNVENEPEDDIPF